MSRISLAQMQKAAEKELRAQEERAGNSVNLINRRQNNLTRGKLAGRVFGTIITTLLMLFLLNEFRDKFEAFEPLQKWSGLILTVCALCMAVFGLVMVFREFGAMGHYNSIFKAETEVSRLKSSLHSSLTGLSKKTESFLKGADNGWDVPIALPQNIPARIQEVEDQVLGKADQRTRAFNSFLTTMYYISVIVCGVVGALMFHGILTDALCWVMELLDGIADLDLEGLMEHASLIALISIGIGMILQIWPAKWYATAHDNEPTWWAPFMFLTGILTSFLAALILALLGAAIVLIIFLIGIAIAIGVAILGFYIVSAFCCGG